MPVKNKTLLKNRYKIEKELGRGGMGAVYKSYDEILDINVAVKELLDTSCQSVEQFKKEAKILAKLNHPGLPRVTDYFEDYSSKYLVMDFIEGEDLQKLLEKTSGFISEEVVIQWMEQVLKTVEYIHENGVIHRDIKPSNIKLTPGGKIFLVDFGIAKIGANSATMMGAQGFTPYMAPPEQYTGTGRTGKYSDIYAIGATIYYLLTGQVPAEAIIRAMGTELTKPSIINPSISSETEKIILKSMAIEPHRRYSTAEEMKKEIKLSLNSLKGYSKNPPSAGKSFFRRDIRRR